MSKTIGFFMTTVSFSEFITTVNKDVKDFNSALSARAPIANLYTIETSLRGKKEALLIQKGTSCNQSKKKLQRIDSSLKAIRNVEGVFHEILTRFVKKLNVDIKNFNLALKEGASSKELFKTWTALQEKKVVLIDSGKREDGDLGAKTFGGCLRRIKAADNVFNARIKSPEIQKDLVKYCIDQFNKFKIAYKNSRINSDRLESDYYRPLMNLIAQAKEQVSNDGKEVVVYKQNINQHLGGIENFASKFLNSKKQAENCSKINKLIPRLQKMLDEGYSLACKKGASSKLLANHASKIEGLFLEFNDIYEKKPLDKLSRFACEHFSRVKAAECKFFISNFKEEKLAFFNALDKWVKDAPLSQKHSAQQVKKRVIQFVLGEQNVLDLFGLRFNKGTLFGLFQNSSIPKLSNFQELDLAPLQAWINSAPKNARQPRIEAANTVVGLVLDKVENFEVYPLQKEALNILKGANSNYSGIDSLQLGDSEPAVSEARSTSVGGSECVKGSSGVSQEEGENLHLISLHLALDAWVKGAPQGQKGKYNEVKNKLIDAVVGLRYKQTYLNNTVSLENCGLSSLPDIFRLDFLGVKRLNRLIIKGNPIESLPEFPENLTVERDTTEVGVGQYPSAISCGGGSSPRDRSASDQQEAGSPNTVTEVPVGSGQGLGLSQDLSKKSSSRSRSSSWDFSYLSPF